MNKNIIATILIVLSVGLYFTVTTNFLAQAKDVQALNDQYNSAIDSAKKLISVRDQVIKDYSNVSDSDRQRLSKMIPNSVDNIRLIIDLNNVALHHGFVLENIKAAAAVSKTVAPTPSVPQGANPNFVTIATPVLDTVNVSFDVKAPYLSFISFLQDLEANLRIMDVSSINMSIADNGVYSYNVELKTYWLRQQ